MLEVKNLVKCYSTKGGVTVKALDNVSVKFPETGMVFLLGRSGSGKSTLLNVSGGLDKPDSGEIIVKGRSSSAFSAADFDSYRNTYVGFIFQEYNILNEFTVEQNIALALQLQNKPNDKKAVEELLERVDLAGFGKRKPNTLSGGQKQRVAIARALIKEPEIIMADEPTGALDSNTGKQVFDTLKKLSETKLVIVVSHDREFAEQYGDRIIELKDGQILSDVSKAYAEPQQVSGNVQMISEDTISIVDTEKLTEADVKNIVKMLKNSSGEAIISTSKREMKDVKRACRINDEGNKEYFKDTEEVPVKEYDGKKTKFIKSRLPMAHAVKMGASGLKTKPIRLIFTVLLSVVAFLMFGVVSTFMLYDANYSISEALQEADYPSITVQKYYTAIAKEYRIDNETGEKTLQYENEREYLTRFGVQELKDKNAGGNKYAGIFNFTDYQYSGQGSSMSLMLLNGEQSLTVNIAEKDADYYPEQSVFGFTDCGAPYMTENGFNLIDGKYPENETEIAVPEYLATLFVKTEGSGLTEAKQIVGKKIRISGCNAVNSEEFKVVGVYDVGTIPSKYDELKDSNSTNLSKDERKKLQESLTDYLAYSYNTILYVSSDFYDEYKGGIQSGGGGVYINPENAGGLEINGYEFSHEITEDYFNSYFTEKTVEGYQNQFKFYNLDGTEKTFSLTDGQVYMPKNNYESMINSGYVAAAYEFFNNDLRNYDAEAKAELHDDSEFYLLRNDLYSDISVVKDVVNKWYQKLSYNRYLYDITGTVISHASDAVRYSDAKYDKYRETSFVETYNKIWKYVQEEENAVAPTADDWNTLKTVVDDNLKTDFPQFYYSYYAREMYDKANEKQKEMLNGYFSEGHEFYMVKDWMLNNNASDDVFTAAKQAIEENYVTIVGEEMKDGIDKFEVKKTTVEKLYYGDYKGGRGTLEVVGYYDTDVSNGHVYIVTENFLTSHGRMQKNENEYSWQNVETTDYVAPTDAKYNYAITLTDNTQEEIAAALAGSGSVKFALTSNVYVQLNMFIDMIEEMQQIFLIIGIVFGVFAALMLLNFISVSISAKKKDIGILRAVGARGSDVFKIFFAEAFIIAVICFVLATVGAYVVCDVLNTSMVTVVSMKLLDFNAVNVALILLVSFVISFIATFFPVYMAAKKSPVESIRAL